MAFEIVIRNARAVTPEGIRSTDIGIAGETIAAVSPGLSGNQIIEAEGRLVTPGGIDAHCHIAQISHSGASSADDFLSGSRSALFGGTTTIIPFAPQLPGLSLADGLDNYLDLAKTSLADFSAHLIVSDVDRIRDGEIAELAARGFRSAKAYTTYDGMKVADTQLLRLMSETAAVRSVLLVHAEDDGLVGWATARLVKEGKTALAYHAQARHPLAELVAIQRSCAYALALDARLVIVHVSTDEGLREITRARARGGLVVPEICTHHLFFDDTIYSGTFEDARYVYTPPPRSPSTVAGLRRLVSRMDGFILSSDHVSYQLRSSTGKLLNGIDAPFTRMPNGTPGIECRFPMMVDAALRLGLTSIEQIVKAACEYPARLYGLFPRKGQIAPGADADLVIWDQFEPRPVRAQSLHDNMDFTPYEGRPLGCTPSLVTLRGRVVLDSSGLRIEPGYGRLQGRDEGELPPFEAKEH